MSGDPPDLVGSTLTLEPFMPFITASSDYVLAPEHEADKLLKALTGLVPN